MSARRSVNIYDYPEHLNPFHEDDNHSRLRFWTINKKKTRSNSLSFNSMKDFKESLGRTFSIRRKKRHDFERSSQSINYDSEQPKPRYVRPQTQSPQNETVNQRISITPLPRTRFHERVKNPEPEKSPTTSDEGNPFKDGNTMEKQVATPPRKKKRAPPPPVRQSSLNMKHSETEPSLSTIKVDERLAGSAEVVEKVEATEESTQEAQQSPSVNDDQVEELKSDTNLEELSTKVKIETDASITNDEHVEESTLVGSENDGVKTSEVQCDIADSSLNCSEEKLNNTEDSKTTSEHTVNVKLVTLHCDDNSDIINDSQEELAEDPIKHQDVSVNNNSELYLSSSATAISTQSGLEQKQEQQEQQQQEEEEEEQLEIVEDSSDLLELVQKLQLEVEKLTDDTNNNIITANHLNEQETNVKSLKGESPSNVKTEMNIPQEKENSFHEDDDDNEVITSEVPLSPRLVRLKKDTEWIRK